MVQVQRELTMENKKPFVVYAPFSIQKMWFSLQNPESVDSPALLVYPERIRRNIDLALRLAGGSEWLRPHVKTHKMAAVARLQLDAGIRQFKCATIAEAEMLAEAGAPDVLLAFPVLGPKAARLAALAAAFPETRFSALVESVEGGRNVSEAFENQPLDVFLDVNVGMDRTGVAPDDAADLYESLQEFPGLRVVGLHAYDGHLRDTDLALRQRQADESFALVKRAQHSIAERFGETLPLVVGGTPPFAIHAQRTGVQVSPGTFVFWDAGYAKTFPDLPFELAAVLLTRVISIVDDTTLCLDLGHKSVAAENPLPRVVFLNQPDVEPIRQSEEHLVVRVHDARQHAVGEVWYGVPIHICPTVALYEAVFVVENGVFTEKWPVTARDRKLKF